jgi:hypothetical protein
MLGKGLGMGVARVRLMHVDSSVRTSWILSFKRDVRLRMIGYI